MSGPATQYLLPDDVGLAGAARALAGHLDVQYGSSHTADRTFYDTFDGRLRREGVVLVHDDDRLALLDGETLVERAGEAWPKAPKRLFAADLAPGLLRDRLAPLADVRALMPIARVRSRERQMRVLNGDAKTVVRLAVEQPALIAPRRALPPRLRLEPVRGYDKALHRVRRTLENGVGLRPAPRSLVDEAVSAAGGTPGGAAPRARVTLRPEHRADEAAAAVLRRMLEIVEANLPGTLADVDTEFLHDLRVAVRRSRSVQRQLAGVFPPEPLAHFRDEFRWLQQATGPARDLDVYVLDFDDFAATVPSAHRAELEPLRGLLVTRRRNAHRRMGRALRSARAAELLSGWSDFLGRLLQAPAGDRPDAARRIDAVAGAQIEAVYVRMLKAGAAIGHETPAEDLHDLRKRGKELRYLLELFGGLHPGGVARRMVGSLKALQDALGRFQDRQVQAAMLRSLGDEVAALDGGASALMTMGLLVERLEEQQAEARGEFAERFARFAADPGRALVRETFA
jgi:CHAD domain-containing protein